MTTRTCLPIVLALAAHLHVAWSASAQPLERVRVSDDRRGFTLAESKQSFTPWGFNYDHDGDGRLIEDYWFDEWKSVEEDFAEMKQLGANVVRVHLQFGKFIIAPEIGRASCRERV